MYNFCSTYVAVLICDTHTFETRIEDFRTHARPTWWLPLRPQRKQVYIHMRYTVGTHAVHLRSFFTAIDVTRSPYVHILAARGR